MADSQIYDQIIEDTGTLAQGMEYFGYLLRINLDGFYKILSNDLKDTISDQISDKINKILQEIFDSYGKLQDNFGVYRDKQTQHMTNQEIFCKDRIEDKVTELNIIKQKLFAYLKEIKEESKSRLNHINDNFTNIKKIHNTYNNNKSNDKKEFSIIDTKQKISTLKNMVNYIN